MEDETPTMVAPNVQRLHYKDNPMKSKSLLKNKLCLLNEAVQRDPNVMTLHCKSLSYVMVRFNKETLQIKNLNHAIAVHALAETKSFL